MVFGGIVNVIISAIHLLLGTPGYFPNYDETNLTNDPGNKDFNKERNKVPTKSGEYIKSKHFFNILLNHIRSVISTNRALYLQ